MFRYISVKNFKSLKDVTFDLTKNKNEVNNFAAIYGENGSGKTNLIETFKLLQSLVLAKGIDKAITSYIYENNGVAETRPFEANNNVGVIALRNLSEVREYRTFDVKEPTEIEYGFTLNGYDGIYYVKFTDEILEEKLYYLADKQRAVLFNISKSDDGINKYINTKVFNDAKYNEELEELLEQYWGKYTYLSLLLSELQDKNAEYMYTKLSINVINVILSFITMLVRTDGSSILPEGVFLDNDRLDIFKGNIESNDKVKMSRLKRNERVLNIFFSTAYADIKSVEYIIKELDNGKIKYELYFKKLIGGKLLDIPHYKESNGTKRILRLFDAIIGALNGDTVVIDEIDNGIHDLLMKNIITSIKDEITGQLIITTHNTCLLKALSKENVYILSTDYEGNKEINSLKSYDVKIQKNNNIADMYLKGIFGGVPASNDIDFETIKYILEYSANKEAPDDEKKA